jgi:hypothetical protein
MSSAEDLLNDLAGIGATIEPAGNRLVLRAGPTTIPATLVGQIRKAKHELMATLVAREERGVVQTDNVRRCGRKTTNPPQIEERTLRHRTFEDFYSPTEFRSPRFAVPSLSFQRTAGLQPSAMPCSINSSDSPLLCQRE